MNEYSNHATYTALESTDLDLDDPVFHQIKGYAEENFARYLHTLHERV